MDFTLSKEQLMVQKMYREFAQNEVKPLAAEVDENLFAALRADKSADLLMRISAEIDMGRGIIAEIAHGEKTSSSVIYAFNSETEKTNGREKGRRLCRTVIVESVTVTAS